MSEHTLTEATLLERIALGEHTRQQFKRTFNSPDALAFIKRNPTLSKHAFRLLPYRGMGSGIPQALGEWPQIELISELSGNQFTARVQRPKAQWEAAGEQVAEQVTGQVTGQVAGLLRAVGEGSWSRKELMEKLSLKGRDNFEKLYLAPALEAGFIERTIPDKPNSRLQQYRLTDKGRSVLK